MRPETSRRLATLMQSPFLINADRRKAEQLVRDAEDDGAENWRDLSPALRRLAALQIDLCVDAGLLDPGRRSTAP